MITLLAQDLKKKRSNIIKSDLEQYLVYKNQSKENPKRLWFKGSRDR